MSRHAGGDGPVPAFISAGMVTASSTPTSHTDVLSSNASGAIVAPSGGAFVWTGRPLAPVFVDADTCITASTGALSSSSSGAIGDGASGGSSIAPIQPQGNQLQSQWDPQARPTEEQTTVQQAAADSIADDDAWRTALAPSAVPYTVPADVLALIMAQAPAPFVAQPPGLDPLLSQPDQRPADT